MSSSSLTASPAAGAAPAAASPSPSGPPTTPSPGPPSTPSPSSDSTRLLDPWWRLKWWAGQKGIPAGTEPTKEAKEDEGAVATTQPPPEKKIEEEKKKSEDELSGWDRIVSLYTSPERAMEVDIIQQTARMTFFGGFMVGGSSGFAQSSKQYEAANIGRKYLSPSDAVKRRMDYAIVRFARRGFNIGIKCAALSTAIILLTTHTAAYRGRFSPFYFPAYSGAISLALQVGGAFSFPLGPIGMAKAAVLGVTSGLSLSAVFQLYALSIGKNADMAYWQFKREYESELRTTDEFEKRIEELMREQNLWKYQAQKIAKEELDKKLAKNDV